MHRALRIAARAVLATVAGLAGILLVLPAAPPASAGTDVGAWCPDGEQRDPTSGYCYGRISIPATPGDAAGSGSAPTRPDGPDTSPVSDTPDENTDDGTSCIYYHGTTPENPIECISDDGDGAWSNDLQCYIRLADPQPLMGNRWQRSAAQPCHEPCHPHRIVPKCPMPCEVPRGNEKGR